MSRQNENRKLVPAYHRRGLLIGWRCSACDKQFRVADEEATDEFAPPKVRADFDAHSCVQTILDDFRRKNAS